MSHSVSSGYYTRSGVRQQNKIYDNNRQKRKKAQMAFG